VSKQENLWTVFVETSLDTSFSSNFDYMSLFNTTTTTTSESNDSASPSSPPLVLSPPSSSPQPQLPSFNSKEDVMLFFKYYDHKTGILRYVFRMHLPVSANLKSIQEKINKKMKFPPGTDLLFFEEVKITQITPLVNRDISLEQLAHEQLLDGDIYVFQQDEKEKLTNYKLPTVTDYFRDLSLQLEIMFCDKNATTTPNNNTNNEDGFILLLSLKMKYDEFAKLVGQHLNYDYQKLQFFRTSTYDLKGSIMQAIKYNPEFQLKDAVNMTTNNKQQQMNQNVRKIYYQKLNIKITELEERRQFKCI
jgi:ubiquitin carboxyl-terminal hydrolase 7